MAESAAKKKTKAADGAEGAANGQNGEPQTLDQLVLDKQSGKYQVVEKISFWAKELRKMEEHRHLTQTEILELAMTQVLAGTVSDAELTKRMEEAKSSDGAAGSEEDAESSKK